MEIKMDSKNVAKVVIRNKQGEILVLTRADNGNYDLPGGHMLVGETSIMGAIREVFEETKLVLLNIEEILKYKRKVLFESNSYASLGETGEIDLDLKENVKYEWMSPNMFLKILDENATDVVTAYKAYIRDDEEFWSKLR